MSVSGTRPTETNLGCCPICPFDYIPIPIQSNPQSNHVFLPCPCSPTFWIPLLYPYRPRWRLWEIPKPKRKKLNLEVKTLHSDVSDFLPAIHHHHQFTNLQRPYRGVDGDGEGSCFWRQDSGIAIVVLCARVMRGRERYWQIAVVMNRRVLGCGTASWVI